MKTKMKTKPVSDPQTTSWKQGLDSVTESLTTIEKFAGRHHPNLLHDHPKFLSEYKSSMDGLTKALKKLEEPLIPDEVWSSLMYAFSDKSYREAAEELESLSSRREETAHRVIRLLNTAYVTNREATDLQLFDRDVHALAAAVSGQRKVSGKEFEMFTWLMQKLPYVERAEEDLNA